MGLLGKKQDSLLLLDGMMKLNELTLDIFPECSDYIFVKNKEYELIKRECLRILDTMDKNRSINKIIYTE